MNKTIWRLYNENKFSEEVANELLDAWYGRNQRRYR